MKYCSHRLTFFMLVTLRKQTAIAKSSSTEIANAAKNSTSVKRLSSQYASVTVEQFFILELDENFGTISIFSFAKLLFKLELREYWSKHVQVHTCYYTIPNIRLREAYIHIRAVGLFPYHSKPMYWVLSQIAVIAEGISTDIHDNCY